MQKGELFVYTSQRGGRGEEPATKQISLCFINFCQRNGMHGIFMFCIWARNAEGNYIIVEFTLTIAKKRYFRMLMRVFTAINGLWEGQSGLFKDTLTVHEYDLAIKK